MVVSNGNKLLVSSAVRPFNFVATQLSDAVIVGVHSPYTNWYVPHHFLGKREVFEHVVICV